MGAISVRFIILICSAIWLIRSEKRQKLYSPPSALVAMGLLSLVTSFFYSIFTSITTRSHDLGGHAEYVQYLKVYRSLPAMTLGWETYQPPFYYFCVVLLEKIGIYPQDFSYLLFSLSVVFFVFWLKRKNFADSAWIAIGWMGLLPACVFYSARLNNDVPFLLYGVLFLYLYDRIENSKRELQACVWLGILCAFSLMTKMSGMVFVWALIPMLLRNLIKFKWANIFALTLPAAFFLVLWSVRSFYQTGSAVYMNTVGMPTQLFISNNLNRFLGFNLETYLQQVSADPWGGVLRNQISPYFFVTALQGEFPYSLEFSNLFKVERIAFLLIVGASLAVFIRRKTWKLLSSGPVCLVGAQILFYLILCLQNAFAPIQDARYWAAAYPAVGYLFAMVIQSSPSRAFRIGYASVFVILFLSFLLFYWKLLRVS